MIKAPGLVSRKLKSVKRIAGALVEWNLMTPRTRQKLAAQGIIELRDYIDVRLGLEPQTSHRFLEWIEKFGFGLVKEPTDIYSLMRVHLDNQPDFAFVSEVRFPPQAGQSGSGFTAKRLRSGAWFYSCPFERDTQQARAWLVQTSEFMGFVPNWRDAVIQ